MLKKLCMLAAIWLPATYVDAKVLNVMTSYPHQVVSAFQQAFEETHPDVELTILWRRPDDALNTLLQNKAEHVDVVWMPSATTFKALADHQLLQPANIDLTGLPQAIGDMAISDAQQRYLAFEIAGYGVFVDKKSLESEQRYLPQTWRDLTDPLWQREIAIPVPSKVGFAPMLVDQLIQSQGWEKGWILWQKIAANGELISQNAQFMTERVQTGEVKAALVMDFFAFTSMQQGDGYQFIYPQQTAFNPAHIGITSHSKHLELARDFVEFMLSQQGQSVLLNPDVKRLPVRESLYETHHLSANPFQQKMTQAYDYQLGNARRGYISMIFDAAITDIHPFLVKAWALVFKLKQTPLNTADTRQLVLIQQKLESWPITEADNTSEMVKACGESEENTLCMRERRRISALLVTEYEQAIKQLERLRAKN